MSQDKIEITTTPPLPGTQLVAELNDAFQAVATDFAGVDDPAQFASAYSMWADTGTGELKRRNANNSAWEVVGDLFPSGGGVVSLAGDQTLAGVKTFTSSPIVPDATTAAQPVAFGQLNATGSAPIFSCRAWVNFNGTGTVAIRASGNVSSITDNGAGDYTVNFATAMPDVNYAMTSSAGGGATSRSTNLFVDSDSALPTATAIRVLIRNENNADMDASFVLLSFFR